MSCIKHVILFSGRIEHKYFFYFTCHCKIPQKPPRPIFSFSLLIPLCANITFAVYPLCASGMVMPPPRTTVTGSSAASANSQTFPNTLILFCKFCRYQQADDPVKKAFRFRDRSQRKRVDDRVGTRSLFCAVYLALSKNKVEPWPSPAHSWHVEGVSWHWSCSGAECQGTVWRPSCWGWTFQC